MNAARSPPAGQAKTLVEWGFERGAKRGFALMGEARCSGLLHQIVYQKAKGRIPLSEYAPSKTGLKSANKGIYFFGLRSVATAVVTFIFLFWKVSASDGVRIGRPIMMPMVMDWTTK